MILRVQIDEDLFKKFFSLRKNTLFFVALYSIYILILNFFGEKAFIEFFPSSLLSLITFCLASLLCISLFQTFYPLIEKRKTVVQIATVLILFFIPILLTSGGEMTFFDSWYEIIFIFSILVATALTWKRRVQIVKTIHSFYVKRIKRPYHTDTMLASKYTEVRTFVVKQNKPLILLFPYLILYALVFILGTIIEWILMIIFFPFKLYYRLFSTRFMLFALSQLLLIIVVVSAALYSVDRENNDFRLNALIAKSGGVDTLQCSQAVTIPDLTKSIVRVVGGSKEGSGFVYHHVEGESLILTNYHVIADEPSPKVVYNNTKFLPATIISADKDADVAVLAIDTLLPEIEWGDSKSLIYGEDLLIIGFPFGKDLIGDPSIKKGGYYGTRVSKMRSVDFIQTDATVNEGMSGGITTDICGRVMGMNTYGAAGFGLSLSSNSIREILSDFKNNGNKKTDIATIKFEEDKNPEETVKSFYNYIKMGNFKNAYVLLSEALQEEQPYEDWVEGYKNTMQVNVISIKPIDNSENELKVKISVTDLIDEEIVGKYYEGNLRVEKIGDHNRLVSANMSEVTPDFYWFFE